MSTSLNTQRLKECRERIGVSKMEVAKRSGLSQPAYLRYESGERTPSVQTLHIIASVLNTSIEYLTDMTNDPSPTRYIISKKDNPELFSIIKLCSNAKSNDLKRILSYAKKLNVLEGI